MTQYYIIEIQQYVNGEYGHIVHYAFDEDADKARLKAESIYHQILAAAAVSETKKHSAVILSDESFPLLHACYKHDVFVPEPEEPASDGEDEEEPTGEEEAPENANEGDSEGGDGE